MKNECKSLNPSYKIRVKQVEESELVKDILYLYVNYCTQKGKTWTQFEISEIPRSVNHQYIKTRYNIFLDPKIIQFRKTFHYEVLKQKVKWSHIGATSAVILLYSPKWITKQYTIRKMDCDNRVKPIFDALQLSLGFEDERFWNFSVFKVASKKEFMKIYLFELGDIIEYVGI